MSAHAFNYLLPPQAERSEAEEAIHRCSRTRKNTARSESQAFFNFVSCSSADFAGAENYC